jgi:hypothetical protein
MTIEYCGDCGITPVCRESKTHSGPQEYKKCSNCGKHLCSKCVIRLHVYLNLTNPWLFCAECLRNGLYNHEIVTTEAVEMALRDYELSREDINTK